MRERTKLVIVLAKPGAAEVRNTVEIAEAYKRSFGQEAVLRTITPACVSFLARIPQVTDPSDAVSV